MFTRPLGMSVHQLWYLLAIVSSIIFSDEDSQKSQKRTLVTLNQQMTEISQWNYSSD